MLKTLQEAVSRWSRQNFGLNYSQTDKDLMLDSLAPLMGIGEEYGELLHATLKYHQGIRGYDDPNKYERKRDDAVGDIMIYLLDYCSREGIDLMQVTQKTWDEIVKKRNWKDLSDGPERQEGKKA